MGSSLELNYLQFKEFLVNMGMISE